MEWLRNNRVSLILLGIIVAMLAAAWSFWPRATPKVGMSAPLPAAREVKATPKIMWRTKYVYVYPDRAKKKLLPKPVADDPAKKLIATGKLDAEERPYTLSTVLDTQTGESQVYARPDPLPWIAPGRHGAFGVNYGPRNGRTGAEVYAWRDLLQVKALHVGVRASVDQHGDNFAGGYIEYRY